MENASKALIIAGAILLSILIIGLGMFIYTQAQEAIGGAGLTSEQVTAYNSKFLAYEGTRNGASVRSLCDTVRNHNNVNTDDASQQIGILYENGSKGAAKTEATIDDVVDGKTITDVKTAIKNGKTYFVDFDYAKSGKIISVKITDKTDKTE